MFEPFDRVEVNVGVMRGCRGTVLERNPDSSAAQPTYFVVLDDYNDQGDAEMYGWALDRLTTNTAKEA